MFSSFLESSLQLPWQTVAWIAALAALALLVLSRSFTIARGNQLVVLERRWFGKQMPAGRTVALKDEVGVQARVLGPGFHLLLPFIYKVTKREFCVIKKTRCSASTTSTRRTRSSPTWCSRWSSRGR